MKYITATEVENCGENPIHSANQTFYANIVANILHACMLKLICQSVAFAHDGRSDYTLACVAALKRAPNGDECGLLSCVRLSLTRFCVFLPIV